MCVLYYAQKLLFIGIPKQSGASMVGENIEGGQGNNTYLHFPSFICPSK